MESGSRAAEEGLCRLSERLDVDPDSPLFLPQARAYQSEGRLEEAIALCLKGLERYPRYVSARVALGAFYLEAGDLEEGARELKRAIGEAPQNLLARRLLADLYERRGERAAALEMLGQLARLSLSDRELEGWMARLRETQEGPGEAPPVEAGAEEALPTESLAKLYESQGLFAEALETYEKLLEREPGNQRLQKKVKLLEQWSTEGKAAPKGREEAEASRAEKPAEVTVEEGSGIEEISLEAEIDASFEERGVALEEEGIEIISSAEAPTLEEKALEPHEELEPSGEALPSGAEIEKIQEEPEEPVSKKPPATLEEEPAPGEAQIEAILEESSLEEALADYRAALAENPSDQLLQDKVRELSEKLGREVPEVSLPLPETQEGELSPAEPLEERAVEASPFQKISTHEEVIRNLEQWLENIKKDTRGDQGKAP